MSFLARTSFRSASRLQTVHFAPRAFSTSFVVQKGPVETVKDGVKTVDRAVADKLVEGIELGEQAAQKAKEAAGVASAEAKGTAAETSGKIKGKAEELRGQAKAKEAELKSKV